MQTNLPVAACLTELRTALKSAPAAILTAETGSGKTTWLPLQLMQESWLAGRKIIMLEPRRVAARAAAARLAFHLNEQAGKTVGYSVRFDSKVGRDTRIEVVTEGILARRLVGDPELAAVGLIIFDEFHERHVETDMALALALESRRIFREDLKLLIMSATIDTAAISRFLGSALDTNAEITVPVVSSAGRNFPVEILYHRDQIEPGNRAMALACARAALKRCSERAGDALVFLPGVAEIFMVTEFLEEMRLQNTDVLPLYGELSAADQDKVLEPARPHRRRIIVATPIAESSITLEGVTVVIDSGLVRQPALDAGTGLSYLETVPVTQDSAVQRAGRAGRVAAGECLRMYTEADFRRRPKTRTPEIMRTELSAPVLAALAYGANLRSLPLPDRPADALFAQAERLLHDLRATDKAGGKLTDLGRQMAALPLPPRIAAMLIAEPRPDVALLAAQLSERDAMRLSGAMATDLTIRFEALCKFIKNGIFPANADRRSLQVIQSIYAHLLRFMRLPPDADLNISSHDLAPAVLYAYPDRVAMQRELGSFIMRGGRGVIVDKSDWLANAEFIVAVDLSGAEKNAKLRLGVGVSRELIMQRFGDLITTQVTVREAGGKPRAYLQTCLDALVLSEKETELAAEHSEALLIDAIQKKGLDKIMDAETQSLCQRVEMLRAWGRSVPDCSLQNLGETIADWLAPFIPGMRALSDLDTGLVREAIRTRIGYTCLQEIERELPERFTAPSGSSHTIRYAGGKAIVSVRLQEVFGLSSQPSLATGKLPVTFELLSPGKQPLATTSDLPAFWKNTYAEVRKEMRGRYPRHFWPEDPLSMQGTTGTKKAFDRRRKT